MQYFSNIAPWWFGDFVAGKNGHQDTKALRYHKVEEIKNP